MGSDDAGEGGPPGEVAQIMSIQEDRARTYDQFEQVRGYPRCQQRGIRRNPTKKRLLVGKGRAIDLPRAGQGFRAHLVGGSDEDYEAVCKVRSVLCRLPRQLQGVSCSRCPHGHMPGRIGIPPPPHTHHHPARGRDPPSFPWLLRPPHARPRLAPQESTTQFATASVKIVEIEKKLQVTTNPQRENKMGI